MTYAENLANLINKTLESHDVQICNYSRRFIIKKGNVMVAEGNCLRVNGAGPSFIIGTFKAYKH